MTSEQYRRITKNLVVATTGEIAGASLNVVIAVVTARYLGVELYGQYAYVLAFVAVFQLVANAGLTRVLVREIAVDRGNAARYIGVVKSLTWVLSLLAFSLIVAGIRLVSASPEIRLATSIAGGAVIATIHAACYAAVFRAFEEMEVNALGFVLHKLVFLTLVLAAAWLDRGFLGMCIAFLLANLFLWAFYLAVLVRRHFYPRLRIDPKLWWTLITESAPLGVAAIIRRVAWQIDILVLTAFGMTSAAGYFSAGYKLIQSMDLIPLTVAQVAFPMLSRLARSRPQAFQETFDRLLKFLFFLAVPLALVLSIGSPRIIALLYGPAFAPASEALAVVAVSLLFFFPASLFVFVFTALGAQRLYTVAALACLAVNISMDLALIPFLAQIGAALATLTAEVTLFVVCLFFLGRLKHRPSFPRLIWRPLVAGLAMGAVLFVVRGAPLPFFLAGTAGSVALYGGLLVALRAISPGEIAVIRAEIRSRLSRAPAPSVTE